MLEEPEAESRAVLVGAMAKMSVGWAAKRQRWRGTGLRTREAVPLSSAWRVRYCFDCSRRQPGRGSAAAGAADAPWPRACVPGGGDGGGGEDRVRPGGRRVLGLTMS